jgi:Salmonella virulence plasmid 65kDa B protein/Insecticide toxin TcdB middle/C-terminal region/Insecticide toxin TcdB middle/N-terminal region
MASDQSPGQKPQRAADLLPGVTLPKGGGAIRGIGEKFTVNAATGTGAMAVPVRLSPGRSGFTPQLRLAYDSGAGNGPFGFGWNLDVPAITRKTDKGLPRYQDDDESDVFILSGAEDLVPILDAAGARKQLPRTVFGVAYQLRFYRPRVEGLFARIERWTEVATGISHWRSISRDNVTTLYGLDAASRIADPADSRRIFSWRIRRSFDDKGNVAVYRYVAEDGAGVDPAQAHEANRTTPARSSQIYLQAIQYGNLEPYIPVWSAAAETPLPGSFMFQVVLDFGDHAPVAPTPQRDRSWPVRPDPFSTYRAGFEIRTYRRVQRLLFFNNFPSQPEVGADGLVRSLDLAYSDQQSPADPRAPIYTFVASMTQTGYRRNGGSLIGRSLPPLEFAYSQPQIQQDVLRVDRDSLDNLPEGLDGTRFRFVDLDGEGLPGILAEARNAWYYKPNLGADNLIAQPDGSLAARARFGPPETVVALPSRAELSGQQLLALAGDGRLDVVDFAGPDVGFFKRTIDAGFEPLRRFLSLPQVDWSDPNTKLVDLTGDGLADILLTEDGLFTFHPSLGEAGFDAARTVHTPWDEDMGPKVVLADGSETIFLADMSGDGLTDIVRVRNGEACYWPNVGYGRFGPKVTMDRAPRFDNQERFDPRRIRLADIDGTGAADLIYVGEDGVRAWFNKSGNAWSAPSSIGVFPAADQLGSVQAMDLLGTGTSCLVWSSPLPGEGANPLLYVDLMGGRKPHLLVQVRNNLGAETRLTYAPSTRFYLADKAAGKPWITRLPFPVQVVERVESIDWIGRNRLITRYAYHHGHFDGYEREFRGFGMVEQHDTEEFRTDTAFADGDFVNWDQQSWSPPMRTCTWFHTGAFEDALAVSAQYATEYWTEPALRRPPRAADAAAMRLSDTVLPANLDPFENREAYRALKGQALRIETYADDGAVNAGNPYTVTEQNFTILCLQNMGANPHAVFFVHPREAVTFHYERGNDDPRVGHEITLETDLYGNVKRSVSVGYPRRDGYAVPETTLSATAQAMLAYDQTRPHARASEHRYTNAIDDHATWPDAYRAPLPCATDAAEITGIKPSTKGAGITNLFAFAEWDNGDPHNPGIWQTAWTGNRDIAYEAIPASDVDGTGVLPGATTRRFVARSRTLYRGDDLTALLAAGQLQPRALPGESYTAALTQGQLDTIFGTLVTPAILREGGYVQLAGESGWWMPSGRLFHSPGDNDAPAQELAFALAHFFLPRRALDPFGAVSRIDYDGFDLLPATATDPVGNATSAVSDYRVLMPATVTDPNGNRAAMPAMRSAW